jgi:hypothetical protein
MRCAQEGCRRAGDVVVDVGGGLLVVLCGRDAVVVLAQAGLSRIVKVLGGASLDVTIRPRGA